MTSALACPVCGAALVLDAAAARCANNHGFDRARNGYVNLLLSNKKQSKEPGDSPAMLQSRRAFLERGYYDGMSAAANDALSGISLREDAHIADLGCGEGFFTARMKAAFPTPAFYGVDISRPGIKMAASRDHDVTWVVASLHRSPFVASSLSVALSVFAPIDAADVRRVIRDDGVLITVTPGPDHLDGLRGIIYGAAKPHPATLASMAGDTHFARVSSARVRYPIALESQTEIMDLVAMTPYYWHIGRATTEAIEAIEALTRLDLTVDASVNVFRPI